MAKAANKTKTVTTKSKPVATPAKTKATGKAVPSDTDALLKQLDGVGLSQDINDNIVPLVYVLQPLSPQVLKKNEAHIDGAEPGHIWLRNADEALFESIEFQPCHHYTEVVEWVPRVQGGGLVARHAAMPTTAVGYMPEGSRVMAYRSPAGYDLVETHCYAGYVLGKRTPGMQYVIPFAKTGLKIARGLMTSLNQREYEAKDGSIRRLPLFGSVVSFKTKMYDNVKGEWYLLNVEGVRDTVTNWHKPDPEEWEQFLAGMNLYKAFSGGLKIAEAPMQPGVGGESDIAGAGDEDAAM